VPHPLTGDYTPKPQEEIDDSLYVYSKKGPQKPETSVSDDKFNETSVTSSEEVVSEPKPKEAEPVLWNNANRVNHANHFVPRPVQLNTGRENVNTSRANVNTGRANVNSVRANVNSVRSNVNIGSFNINTDKAK
ncbi:hypothetical protein Tco_0177427, partial [Tanacetum coccineum]